MFSVASIQHTNFSLLSLVSDNDSLHERSSVETISENISAFSPSISVKIISVGRTGGLAA